jgi:hypothetical protein
MSRLHIEYTPIVPDTDWMPFPGGELEGRRPRALCTECRNRLQRIAAGTEGPVRPALCFQCYRVELERNRAIKAAGELDTASEARFQTALPFEPVNRTRLARLRTEREASRVVARKGVGFYVEKRRRAQIEARHSLARILQGLRERRLRGPAGAVLPAAMVRPAESMDLQLPESWLPFVVAR